MSERKEFEQYKVDIVYRLQDGICLKCGNPLINGFHRHHKSGDRSDNNIDNLELLCPKCHGDEQYNTLQEQKKRHLQELDDIVARGIDGKIAGAILDKLVDAIKLALSLEKQVYGTGIEEAPAAVKVENYLMSSGLLMKKYEEGFTSGLQRSVEIIDSLRKIKESRER